MSLDKDVARLTKKLDRIAKIETARAHASAINKLSNQVKTAVSSLVSKETRIPVRTIKRRVYNKRATAANGVAKIYLYAKPIPGIDARASRTNKGWKVAGQFRPRSFLAKMPNQSRHHIFQRDGRGPVLRPNGKRKEKFDMVRVNISDPVARIGMAVIEFKMRKDYPKLLKHELNARLQGYVTRAN